MACKVRGGLQCLFAVGRRPVIPGGPAWCVEGEAVSKPVLGSSGAPGSRGWRWAAVAGLHPCTGLVDGAPGLGCFVRFLVAEIFFFICNVERQC